MAQYSWDNCPETIHAQVQSLCTNLQRLLGAHLVGIYLHGSLAMGCFNPQRSDLDLLVVTTQRLTIEIKREIAALLLHTSQAPVPLEISFLVEQELHPFIHPLPFDLHYSETWRAQFQQELATEAWQHWNDTTRHDNDLSAHITIMNARGHCLYGKPIAEVFPPVPSQDYLTAIIDDFEDARAEHARMPVYFVLNACRVYAYLREQLVLSKDEGGVWGIRHLPPEFCPVIEQALLVYRGEHTEESSDQEQLDQFATYIDGQIQTALRDH